MLTSNCRLPRYPGFSIRIHVQEHVVSGVQAVMVHVVCRSGTFLGLLVERERARVRERNSPPTPLTCPRSIAPRAFRKVSMPQSIICEHTHARRQREAVGANAASSGAAPPLSLVSGRGRCHSGAPCLSRRPAHAVARARPETPKHDRAVTARCAPKTKWEVTNGASCCWHLKSYSLSTVKREVPVGPRVRRAGARRTGLLWPPILGIERARLEGRGRLAQAGFESTAAEPSRSQRERERERARGRERGA